MGHTFAPTMPTKMHADEIETSEQLVSRLVARQFPQWAQLPIARVASAGTDNALYKLGPDMVVRLPRIAWAVEAIEKEQFWLPKLGSSLPLAVPRPIARGLPAEGYPWDWSVYTWLDGESATATPPDNLEQAAADIAEFIAALRSLDPTGGPRFKRSSRLAAYDALTRTAIEQLEGMIDAPAVTRVWDQAVCADPWDGTPVWVHGDLDPGNLLVSAGRIRAVIDFGSIHVGDPARDMKPAWSLLTADSRSRFRDLVAVDDGTWARGRGMVLAEALQNLLYYNVDSNPTIVRMAHRKLGQLVAD